MVAPKKIESKKKLNEIFKSHKSVIVFDLAGLPSSQLHEIRNTLKEKEIYTLVAKKKVLEKAIHDSKIKLEVKEAKQPAIIYSNKGIFEVAKNLKQISTKRKAKAGETAPEDIVLPVGPTPAQAGPAISIFKQFAIQTMIKDGKIGIREAKTVCKKGESVPAELISLLNMLSITPIDMLISPSVGYSENLFYTKDVFDISEELIRSQVLSASAKMTKVTYKIGYPTKQNANLLLAKGWRGARTLGIKIGIPSKEIMKDMVIFAHSGAKKLEK